VFVHVFHVEAARAHREHRTELTGRPRAQQDLGAESHVVERHLFHEKNAAKGTFDVAGRFCGPGNDGLFHRGVHRRRPGGDEGHAPDVGLMLDPRRDDLQDDDPGGAELGDIIPRNLSPPRHEDVARDGDSSRPQHGVDLGLEEEIPAVPFRGGEDPVDAFRVNGHGDPPRRIP
jgi:hypothetical protein